MAEPKIIVWKGVRYREEDAPEEAKVEHKKRSPKNKQKK